MQANQKWNWIFPAISLFMFVTLAAALFLPMDSMGIQGMISFSSGLLAYTMMLTVTFMASRPRFIEKYLGLPDMYSVHALMAVVMSILVILHVVLQWNGLTWITDMSIVSQTGFLAIISLLLVFFSGIFSLSGVFVDNFPGLRNFKNNVMNREVNLWIHRLSIVAIIAIYIHIFLVFGENRPFLILLSVYTIAILGYYFIWKIQQGAAQEFRVKAVELATPDVRRLELEPLDGKLPDYVPGDYFFIRANTDEMTNEGHPFSVTSAPIDRFSDSIEFMIKEDGDWTESLQHMQAGDTATLEGPYGNFFTEAADGTKRPFVLLCGGIGITPNLSIVRYEAEKEADRPVHLIWGIDTKEDLFGIEEFEQIKKNNPNFDYHIIFSGEEVEGFAHGFIDANYLEEIGLKSAFQDAVFFVCGPPPMLNASKQMLADNNVDQDHIFIDEFGF